MWCCVLFYRAQCPHVHTCTRAASLPPQLVDCLPPDKVRLIFPLKSFHPLFLQSAVPIIPSYLYSLDQSTNQSTDLVLKDRPESQEAPPATFQTIVSLYDHTVKSVGSNATGRPADLVPDTQPPQNSSACPEATSLLTNENVKVGMMFASKATVQLITNPFIGPLTNRYLQPSEASPTHNPLPGGASLQILTVCPTAVLADCLLRRFQVLDAGFSVCRLVENVVKVLDQPQLTPSLQPSAQFGSRGALPRQRPRALRVRQLSDI